MERAVELEGYPPPRLKSELGEEAGPLEQGQRPAEGAVKENVTYFSATAPASDLSGPMPVFTGMVDAFPAISVGVDPTVCPLGYELGFSPTLEVVSGPSPDTAETEASSNLAIGRFSDMALAH